MTYRLSPTIIGPGVQPDEAALIHFSPWKLPMELDNLQDSYIVKVYLGHITLEFVQSTCFQYLPEMPHITIADKWKAYKEDGITLPVGFDPSQPINSFIVPPGCPEEAHECMEIHGECCRDEPREHIVGYTIVGQPQQRFCTVYLTVDGIYDVVGIHSLTGDLRITNDAQIYAPSVWEGAAKIIPLPIRRMEEKTRLFCRLENNDIIRLDVISSILQLEEN
ncbi:hypothetical protein C8F04DRAFT_1198880 [Mycena alexandri]|uniref:Uncharacterized protein n=1 Tax=Mycena alexandri TaxID=1745969 RepID=A0AAD6S278_9AGAR|nr:hypothetical protein C8F04DRAFT_1198880 [Mycena alexandri]